MVSGFVALLVGLLLLLIAGWLWKKGAPEEPLWQSFVEAVIDVFTLQFFSTFKSSALVLYLAGSIVILFSILYLFGVLKVTGSG